MFNKSHTLLRSYGLAMLMAVSFSAVAWSCPNCKDALANDPAQAGLVRGFFWSIMFMVSMPFLIFGGVSAYFYWEIRRSKLVQQVAMASNADQVVDDSPFDESIEHEQAVEPVAV